MKRKAIEEVENENLVFSLRKMTVLDPPDVQLADGLKKLKVDDVNTTSTSDSSHFDYGKSCLSEDFKPKGPVHSYHVPGQSLTLVNVAENGKGVSNHVLKCSSNGSASAQDEVLSCLLPCFSWPPVLPSVLKEDCDWLGRNDH